MPSAFQSDVWNSFDERTSFGRVPYLFEEVLPLRQGFAGAETVEAAFRSFRERVDRQEVDSRVRVYDGEVRRDDLVESSLSQEIEPDESLMGFMQRLTGKQRFSLVINNLEQLSSKLAADFGAFIQSFFALKGFPIGGVEQVAFCGNYAGTAFGIHEGYEHAFLCHLGPGTKNFYCWSREQYLGITGTRHPTFSSSKNFSELMEVGEVFVLKPGDVLYLPASVYHIGTQEDYSVSVALPLYTYPLERFVARKVVPALSDATLPFNQEGMSSLLDVSHMNPLVTPVAQLLGRTMQSWLSTELPRYLTYYWHRLRSNGGWELPQQVGSNILTDTIKPMPSPIARGSRVSLRQPYVAIYERGLDCSAQELRTFLAAGSVVLPDPSGRIAALLDRLNCGELVHADTDELVTVFCELSRTGGVECSELSRHQEDPSRCIVHSQVL
jgi:hypothetical protein